MAANSETSTQTGKRNTRNVLSVGDRLNILQQAALDLASSGITAQFAEFYGNGAKSVAIIIPGTIMLNDRIVPEVPVVAKEA